MIGKTLAHYEVTGLLGQGGMGEVYRARDTKLDRDVALKLLHDDVASDAERLARFRREARVLASLNHPNIASLYGLEEADSRVFLVMELVEGADLSDHIARGPISVDEVTRIATELARGLENAHENGVVHRDLKPSNVKLTPEGDVRILDFGLARVYSGDENSSTDLENSPTITAAFTAPGVILGTAAYMSPEQARGRSVDRRTDIWAFGVIVWEMLTGERLFAGETVSDTLAAVLTREVDTAALPSSLPDSLRHLISRCLERDPRRRLRDMGEARLMLEFPEVIVAGVTDRAQSAPARTPPRVLLALPWVLLVGVLALGLPRLLGPGNEPAAEERVRRFEIVAELPRLTNTRAVEISPDGRRIAIFAQDGLWVRELDEIEPQLLCGPEDLDYDEVGATPFWSPDSEFIAYGAQGRLWKVAADGGTPSVICTLTGRWGGGAWSAEGQIVICTSRGPMYTVPARGGDPSVLIPLDGGELDFHQPAWVADGGGFVYAVHRREAVDTIELLRAGQRKVLLRIEEEVRGNVQVLNNPVYSPSGHIVYQRDQGNRGLWALPFDAHRGEVIGAPFPVRTDTGHPSISADGTLIHMALSATNSGEVVVASRTGEIVETLTEELLGGNNPMFSPDARRVVFTSLRDQSLDVSVVDRGTRIVSHLTLSGDDETDPRWIPGSDRVAYVAADATGCNAVWSIRADGRDEPELLASKGRSPSFGPDGLDLVCQTQCMNERGLIHHRLGSGEEPVILREHPASIQQPEISPDGRYIAYMSWETGAASIEVADFPAMTGRRILVRSETRLRWSRDSREIYYVEKQPDRLVAAVLEDGDAFTVQSTRDLFELAPLGVEDIWHFDANADGTEFVFIRAGEENLGSRSFTVVENWFEEFRDQ